MCHLLTHRSLSAELRRPDGWLLQGAFTPICHAKAHRGNKEQQRMEHCPQHRLQSHSERHSCMGNQTPIESCLGDVVWNEEVSDSGLKQHLITTPWYTWLRRYAETWSLLAEVSMLEKLERPHPKNLSTLLPYGNQDWPITCKGSYSFLGWWYWNYLCSYNAICNFQCYCSCVSKGMSEKVGSDPSGSQTLMFPNKHMKFHQILCDFGTRQKTRPLRRKKTKQNKIK